MAQPAEIEIVFVNDDWPFGGLDEVSDPLDEALMAAGVGDVTGGGFGGRETVLRVTLTDRLQGEEVIRRVLAEMGAPRSTRLRTETGLHPLFPGPPDA